MPFIKKKNLDFDKLLYFEVKSETLLLTDFIRPTVKEIFQFAPRG